jgi:signal transduction histidine kinase
MGNLEVALRRSRSAEELRGTVESALEEMGRLSHLLDSLLTLARSDAGELHLSRTLVDAAEIARRAVDPYDVIAAERGIALEMHLVPVARVVADPLWLGRAVQNLVDNACKFTPSGGRVSVAVTGDAEATEGLVRISVADTGPGLCQEERERAFERFYRGAAVRGASEGFGLGLPLARDIVRALGGELRLGSPDGAGGACFVIELPARDRVPDLV